MQEEDFELIGTYKGVTIVDDYAHHPAEIEVTLNAAMKMGYKRVWAVHQPFTYTRTAKLLDDFARVLQIADKCVVSEIMGSREVNKIGIKATDLSIKFLIVFRLISLKIFPTFLQKTARTEIWSLPLAAAMFIKFQECL